MSRFSGEARRGVFGFAEDIRYFVFAADVGEALDFAGAGGGKENCAAGGELRFDVAHASDNVAMKTSAGARGKFELCRATDAEGKLLETDLRGFVEGRGELFLGPEIVLRGGRVGLAVTFVIFGRGDEMCGDGFAE